MTSVRGDGGWVGCISLPSSPAEMGGQGCSEGAPCHACELWTWVVKLFRREGRGERLRAVYHWTTLMNARRDERCGGVCIGRWRLRVMLGDVAGVTSSESMHKRRWRLEDHRMCFMQLVTSLFLSPCQPLWNGLIACMRRGRSLNGLHSTMQGGQSSRALG